MAGRGLVSRGFHKRLRNARVKRGLTQEDLAERAGINPNTVGRYERNRAVPQGKNLETLARALDIDADDLRLGTASAATPSAYFDGQQIPAAIDDTVVDGVHMMAGNHTVPIEISARYVNEPLKIPQKFRPVYDEWLARAAKAARDKGYPFFNGPNTRLLRATHETTDQDPGGHERSGIMLELGPVSWYEWTVLNTFINEPFSPHAPEITPGSVFADRQRLYDNGGDLRWCRLSNIMTVNMAPITSDGYGLIQLRSQGGVSTTGGRLANGVAENIHRYLDEAPSNNLTLRQNTLHVARTLEVDATYAPRGVPSPLLAAQRGLWEEVSEELYWATRENIAGYKFLNVMMEFQYFNPHIIGVIELGLSRAEVEKLVRRSPGKDRSESIAIHYMPLDAAEAETKKMLADQSRWAAVGLGCMISAIHYWKSPRLDLGDARSGARRGR